MLLDGYTIDGNPNSAKRHSSYIAYWESVKNGDRKRRRRSTDGVRLRRDTNKSKGNYARFQEKSTGRVVVANYQLTGKRDEKMNSFEFADGGLTYETLAEADAAKKVFLAEIEAKLGKGRFWQKVKKVPPPKTQKGYDSSLQMYDHYENAMKFITEHVEENNPQKAKSEERSNTENQPFFMYFPYRAPHAPFHHNLTVEEIEKYLPYNLHGKVGEQIGLFDELIGKMMAHLHDLDIADNTMVIFTSDNGPDMGAFEMMNALGHTRTQMLRGLKASGKFSNFFWPMKSKYRTKIPITLGSL